MCRTFVSVLLILAAGILALGCDNSGTLEPVAVTDSPEQEMAGLLASSEGLCSGSAPAPLVLISHASGLSEIWPYTGENFSGTPQDPINLIFVGHADPRDIRAALLSLDGDRSAFGFPPVVPFTSTWDDAIGDVQVAYGRSVQQSSDPVEGVSASEFEKSKCPDGWSGSTIQLACGPYEQLRVHLRLFRLGNCTIANAHFEFMIPGTEQHQVLSWELAEQFVVADFIRSGLIDPETGPLPTGVINASPFRTIPGMIYNLLPEDLKYLISGPAGQVDYDVPINTDGNAMILHLVNRVARVAETREQNFIIYYDQVVPKPFCSGGPADYIYVNGQITMTQRTSLNAAGVFKIDFSADGDLTVTPVDPLTGQVIGSPMEAFVRETHAGQMNNRHASAASTKFQKLGRRNDEAGGTYFSHLQWNSQGRDIFRQLVRCNSESLARQAEFCVSGGTAVDRSADFFGTR